MLLPFKQYVTSAEKVTNCDTLDPVFTAFFIPA